MEFQDRLYQQELEGKVYQAQADGAKNVLMRLDTGGGKTVILSNIHKKHSGPACLIAHRHELVSQLSVTLGRQGIFHAIIGSDKTHRACVQEHIAEFGKSFVAPGAPTRVASVDTLVRAQGLESWSPTVTRWTNDEAHHVVDGNKWAASLARFTHPQCFGLGPTATPLRADGKGLGRHADGVFDAMVEGPPMRWLIEQGYLTDYKIICPESDLDMLDDVSQSGDWSTKQLREAVKRSHIVGDVVKSHLRFAVGKRTITFATDVETANEMAGAYRAAGVVSEVLTGETEAGYRRQMLRNFAAGRIQVIVAVDIISEGFDLPALECVILARPTESLALYMQQFGRSLRPIPGKAFALVIDHVRNVIRHKGPPDKPRVWSLDRRDKKAAKQDDAESLRVCLACFEPFEAYRVKCPHCGAPIPPPAGRGSPEVVAGDMAELSPEVLARLRGEADLAVLPYDEFLFEMSRRGMPPQYIAAQGARHREKIAAQAKFRPVFMAWAGRRLSQGLAVREVQRLFYLSFGMDVVTAQGLGPADVAVLCAKVEAKI